MMTYKQCYERGVSKLEVAGVPEAKLDARLLLEAICGTDRNALLVHGDREVTTEQETAFMQAIDKRMERIPLQHILGYQEFMGFRFRVNEHVLIPRQDTEVLVEKALGVLQGMVKAGRASMQEASQAMMQSGLQGVDEGSDGVKVLDMCTGSGCILISLLKMCKGVTGVGVDISEKALAVAKANGEILLRENPLMVKALSEEPLCETGLDDEPVTWLKSDMFTAVEGKFDVITSNPPYIPTKVIEELMPEVREHEPMGALDGMEDGLFFYRKLALETPKYLKEHGHLFLEIGHDQGEAVSGLLIEHGFAQVEVIKDYAGLDRVVHAML